jgi:hypothetical protein
MNSAEHRINVLSEQKITRSASRYDAFIATFVGLCALCVSGYTAYMQRQQVRAMVWPILEFQSSNDPNIHLSLTNKGVGPAIIRDVTVKVDGQPVRDWVDALERMMGPGKPSAWIRSSATPEFGYSESDMSGRVLSAGESITTFTPWDAQRTPITYDKSNPVYVQMNEARFRIEVEICYCSTLGDCWTLRGGGKTPNVTTPTQRCPGPSAISFSQ